MKKILLSFGMLLCLSAPTWAACAVTNLQVKDNAAVVAAVPYADDGSGASNCSPQVQLKQGGNVLTITAGGAAKVDASATTQPVSGTVTANAGTNLNTSALATSANQPTNAAQASTTSGQTGALVQGAVTTSAPTYTTGQTDPLSLDTGGLLRMRLDGGSAINPNGPATPANSSPVVLAQTTALILNALSSTKTQVKSSAGQLVMLQCGNTNTSEEYVQVFNQASSAVTVGSTAPTLSVPIAASATGGFVVPGGIQMNGATPGITVAATTTATGSSAPSTALDCNVAYQ